MNFHFEMLFTNPCLAQLRDIRCQRYMWNLTIVFFTRKIHFNIILCFRRLDLGMLLQKPTDSQASMTQQSLTAQSLGPQSLSAQSLGAQSLSAQSIAQQSITPQSITQQQSQFMSQFTKHATESIKNAVGVSLRIGYCTTLYNRIIDRKSPNIYSKSGHLDVLTKLN